MIKKSLRFLLLVLIGLLCWLGEHKKEIRLIGAKMLNIFIRYCLGYTACKAVEALINLIF